MVESQLCKLRGTSKFRHEYYTTVVVARNSIKYLQRAEKNTRTCSIGGMSYETDYWRLHDGVICSLLLFEVAMHARHRVEMALGWLSALSNSRQMA